MRRRFELGEPSDTVCAPLIPNWKDEQYVWSHGALPWFLTIFFLFPTLFDTSFVTLLLLAAAVVALKILFTGRTPYKSSSFFLPSGQVWSARVVYQMLKWLWENFPFKNVGSLRATTISVCIVSSVRSSLHYHAHCTLWVYTRVFHKKMEKNWLNLLCKIALLTPVFL